MIIPQQHGDLPLGTNRERIHIGFAADTLGEDLVERRAAAAFGFHPIALHQGGHAEHVQHRFVDAVGRQRAEAVEVRLILELESPRQHALDVRLAAIRQLENVLHHRRGIRCIERAIAIGILRIHSRGTCRAAFRIRLAQHDRQILELWKLAHDRVSLVDVFGILGDTHANMAIHYCGPALCVIGDEVEGRAAAIAMFQELAQKRRSLRARRTRAGRPADLRRWQGALHGRRRVVVELVVLFRTSVPIRDIGFVPDFPIPGLHLPLPVLIDAVPDPLVD